jgi:hypothetical protein
MRLDGIRYLRYQSEPQIFVNGSSEFTPHSIMARLNSGKIIQNAVSHLTGLPATERGSNISYEG